MALPDWVNSQMRRRTIQATPNPMDKATVVSIFPKEIDERKWTIQPGRFQIAKGSYDKPAILVVGTSSWWRELDTEQPLLEIPCSSIQVADSVVRDYCNGLDGCDMGENMPGLFYIPGTITIEILKKDYQVMLDVAKRRQDNWYKALVKTADILWSRSNGNPLSISDDARLAVQELQLKDKAWMKDFTTLELRNCPACGTLRNNNFPVCQHCHHIVDMEMYNKLGLKKVS